MRAPLIFLLTVVACSSHDAPGSAGRGGDPPAIAGMVRATSGVGVADAVVTFRGASARTDAEGRFAFEADANDAGRSLLTVQAAGYLPTAAAVEVGPAGAYRDVYVLDRGQTLEVDATSGGTLVFDEGATVDLPAGAIRHDDGSPYTGEAHVSLATFAAGEGPAARFMPGGDASGTNSGGETGVLLTRGFFSLTIASPTGEVLVTDDDVAVTLDLPEDVAAAVTDATRSWRFVMTTGNWQEAGPVERVGGNQVRLSVNPREPYWNCDDWSRAGRVTGTVYDCAGQPARGALVEIVNGPNRLVGYTDAAGRFTMSAPAGFAFDVKPSRAGLPAIPPQIQASVQPGETIDVGEFVVACSFEGSFSAMTTATNSSGCRYDISAQGTVVLGLQSLGGSDVTGQATFRGVYTERKTFEPESDNPFFFCSDGRARPGEAPIASLSGTNGVTSGSGELLGVEYRIAGGRVAADGESFEAEAEANNPGYYDAPMRQRLTLRRVP